MNRALFEFINGRTVGFFGIGKTNLELLLELSGTDTEIILRSDKKIDRSRLPKGLNIKAVYECHNSTDCIREDILFFSPSVRRDRTEFLCALGRGTVFTSDIEFFLSHNSSPLFLVTGSDGKTTTTALAEQMLKTEDRNAIAIGNIGRSATPLLDKPDTSFVLEASSFMLEYTAPRATRATITSLTPEHLKWHCGYENYKKAKMRAFENAHECVASIDSPDLRELVGKKSLFALTSTRMTLKEMLRSYDADFYYCTEGGYITENGRRLISVSELKRQEEYNIRNYLSALALTKGHTDEDHALSVIKEFSGLEHRCERFYCKGGIEFINSSIDTSPERTANTIKGVAGNIILLLGGRDKGLPLTPLTDAIDDRVKAVLLFGEAAKKFQEAIPHNIDKKAFSGLYDATVYAMEIAGVGDTVLLSPAATSYDEFSSFEERGSFFKRMILRVF